MIFTIFATAFQKWTNHIKHQYYEEDITVRDSFGGNLPHAFLQKRPSHKHDYLW
jgi:hypothetical protein